MAKATLSVAAERDLASIFAFVGQESHSAAERLLSATQETFALVAKNPLLSPEYPHKRIEGVRRKLVSGYSNYSVFYTPTEDGVHVIRVLHNARDIPRVLEEPH
ncbi:MAG: type II toxin-antitoxin system RelE/ParE family toxin [Planctomycetota bacterium]